MNKDKYADFDPGVSDEELTQAYRRHRQRREDEEESQPSASLQSSGRRYVGTPRNAKHTDHYKGVRVR